MQDTKYKYISVVLYGMVLHLALLDSIRKDKYTYTLSLLVFLCTLSTINDKIRKNDSEINPIPTKAMVNEGYNKFIILFSLKVFWRHLALLNAHFGLRLFVMLWNCDALRRALSRTLSILFAKY